VVFPQESHNGVHTEDVGDASLVLLPTRCEDFRISPEEVNGYTLAGDFQRPRDLVELVKVFQFGTESAMHAEDLPLDDCGQRQEVKQLVEKFPYLDACLAFAFLVEAKEAIYARSLVIASKEEDVLWKFDLVGKQKDETFEGEGTSIDVVSEKEIVCISRRT
jgi:hypothetical protein